MYLLKQYQNEYEVIIQDINDMLAIRRILNDSALTVQKIVRSEKVQGLTKSQRPTEVKRITYFHVRVQYSKGKLCCTGTTPLGYQTHIINNGDTVHFSKKLAHHEKEFLQGHKRKEVLYVIYEPGQLSIGHYKNNKYYKLRTHYHNFKDTNLESYVLNILQPYRSRGYTDFIYKTCSALMHSLIDKTGYNWTVLNTDSSNEWKESSIFQAHYKDVLSSYYNKDQFENTIEGVRKADQENNVKKIYFTEKLNENLSYIINETPTEHLIYMPHNNVIDFIMVEGIYVLKYF